jgi:centriolar protein POC1
MSTRRGVLFVLALLAAAVAQQPAPDPLLPAVFPVDVPAAPGFSLTVAGGFRAHALKGESFISVNFSPDGKTLVTGASDGSARLWTLDGKLLQRVENGNMVFKARFDRAGERIITAVYDGSARVWSQDGKLLREYRGHRSAVTDALFLAGGEVATGSDDGSVVLFDVAGEPFARVAQQGVARNQAVAPDQKMLGCAFDSGAVRVTDAKGRVLHAFDTGQGRINDVRFSPDGKRLLTAGFDGRARLWSLEGKPLARFAAGDGDWVFNAAFSRDGELVGTTSGTGLVTIWTAEGRQLAKYRTGHGRVNSIDFSPTEDRFAIADHNGVVLMFRYQRR